MIGRRLSHYRVIEALGQGGMGTVYLAEDERLGRRVAIKVISGSAATDPAARARFLLEARAASALDHPSICAIYQIDQTEDGAPYLVMGHYDGETLDKRIAAGPMRVGEAVALAAQVAEGLAHAHARGVVHRDIKPSNVLRTREGQAKILDFGLAKLLGADSMTATGVSVGTPAYMAPEQVRAETVDARSDVWAVGVLLYALLAGRSPFEADNLAAVTYAILEGEPLPLARVLPRVPDGLQPIVDRCLAKRPADRYPDAGALAADLRRLSQTLAEDDAQTVAADSGSGARTLVIPSTPRRGEAPGGDGAPRRPVPRGVVLGGAGIALASVAATGVVVWQRSHPPAAVRVAVMAPVVGATADSNEAVMAAANALSATLRATSGRRGLAPLDVSELKGAVGFRQTTEAVGADEVLAVSLVPVGEEWKGVVRRLSARDSSVLWAGEFTVSREQPLSLADAIDRQVGGAYPRLAPIAGARRQEMTAADYAEFLDLQRSFIRDNANDVPRDVMRDRLEKLRRRSPRDLEVLVLEAKWASYQYETRHGAEDLALATEASTEARRLAPEDPRPLVLLSELAMLKADWNEAERLLGALRSLVPGDVEVEMLAARVVEARGDRARAIELMERLLRRRASRAVLQRLIRMEYNAGRYDAARTHLREMAARYPTYVFPRSYLAQLELLYGEPARAESLYAALAAEFHRPIYLSNLSLARMLLGRYAEAAEVLREAIALAPDDYTFRLNLADCLALMGRNEDAMSAYSDVLSRIRKDPHATDWASQMLAAQCLAHLGRHPEAIRVTQEVLRAEGENADALFEAALVYALAGEAASALVNTRKAIEIGIQPRWFRLPWFDSLRGKPEFEAALRATPRPVS